MNVGTPVHVHRRRRQTPLYVKTRVLSGLGDGLASAEVCHDALVDLSRKEEFKASDDLACGPAIGGASGDVVAGWLVESHADDDGSISRKIKISFLRCLGPRCSRRRTCGRTGQKRNDLDARRCRECGGIDTNGSACAVPPTPESRPDERRDRPPPLARIFAEFAARAGVGAVAVVALVVHVPAGPHGGAGAPADLALRTCALGRHSWLPTHRRPVASAHSASLGASAINCCYHALISF